MTVAFDKFTDVGANFTGDTAFDHTPVGTPRAVIVFVVQGNGVDEIVGVTYGGVAMVEVKGSPQVNVGGEEGTTHCFFLGSGIPTGLQSVAIDTSSTTGTKRAVCITLTAVDDTEVVNSIGFLSTSKANPSFGIGLANLPSFVALGGTSGQNDPTGYAPTTNWTAQLEVDVANEGFLFYTYDIIGTANVVAGWTQTADDVSVVIVAVTEKPPIGAGATDTFTVGANTYLEDHTPDTGKGWTATASGDFICLAASDTLESQKLTGGTITAKEWTNLNDDDMVVQAYASCTVDLNNNPQMGVMGRIPPGQMYGDDGYVFTARNAGLTWILLKRVAASQTVLSTIVPGGAVGTIKLEISASAKIGYLNGAQLLSSTDDSLLGYNFAGVHMNVGIDAGNYIDNWSSVGGVVVAGVRYPSRSLLGVGR